MTAKTKLELTWVGKDNRPKMGPRSYSEDPNKSRRVRQSGNG